MAGLDESLFFENREYRNYLVSLALRLMKRDFDTSTWRAAWEVTVEGRPAAEVTWELGLTLAAVDCAKFRVLNRLATS